MRPHDKSKDAFTLIELLIVVAIIAILAAIAVPNLLEAQTRAKVSRVKMDFRSLAAALESYCADFNHYPVSWGIQQTIPHYPSYERTLAISLYVLTTPVPYATTVVLTDPFGSNSHRQSTGAEFFPYYSYLMTEELIGLEYRRYIEFDGIGGDSCEYAALMNYAAELSGMPRKEYDHPAYVLWSAGPDRSAISSNFSSDPMHNGPLYFAESAKPGDFRFAYGPGEAWINRLYDPTNGTISDGDLWRRGGQILNTAVPDN